jgi:hypothetical protein
METRLVVANPSAGILISYPKSLQFGFHHSFDEWHSGGSHLVCPVWLKSEGLLKLSPIILLGMGLSFSDLETPDRIRINLATSWRVLPPLLVIFRGFWEDFWSEIWGVFGIKYNDMHYGLKITSPNSDQKNWKNKNDQIWVRNLIKKWGVFWHKIQWYALWT